MIQRYTVRRRVPYNELVRAGLAGAPDEAEIRQLPRKGTPPGAPLSEVLVELVDRLEAQAEELGRLKAIALEGVLD